MEMLEVNQGKLDLEGGLFRDEKGHWILGYTRKLESAGSIETKIWEIYRGLIIMFEESWKEIQVEIDCQKAVELLLKGALGEFHSEL
ncbi:unnamed protein product [Camellia sinensis]